MENGSSGYDGGGGNLALRFSGLAIDSSGNYKTAAATSVGNSNNDGLFQVMKAVEAAEATIKQQVDENNRLRSELQKKMQELAKYKPNDSNPRSSQLTDDWDDRVLEFYDSHLSGPALVNQEDEGRSMDKISMPDLSGAKVFQKDQIRNVEDHTTQSHIESHVESNKTNGTLKVASDNMGSSQISSPSTVSFSPSRYQIRGGYDPQFNFSGQGLMPMADINSSGSLLKQNLGLKAREHEEEILQLQKHLAEFSVREAQIRNEKYVLEKRIAYMRMAFDQQQQDLVDAASKALSYRQDIIEENIRLTYALQAAQQERSTFVSSLMPLLAEYSLQPPNADAQSIVSNLKVLFKHLHEKLILTETRLKESQYQLAPWHSDVKPSNFAPSSSYSMNKHGLELVPQPAYPNGKIPISSDPLTAADWDLLNHHHGGLDVGVAKHLVPDDLGRHSHLADRNAAIQESHAQLGGSWGDLHTAHNVEENPNRQVTFSDPVSSSEMEDPDMDGHHNDTDPAVNWGSKNIPYTSTLDDPGSSYSPYLPPVLEEPSSSFSEAADDDPLPAIEGLQISGEAFPGQALQACGYSINGTTSCNFEWVRHLEDGSVKYIDGAKQPNYLVTADDVETYLAIEVQPLDNRNRKGELGKVFANEHRKISIDPDMYNHIERTLYSGNASYQVSLSAGFLTMREPATLTIKREGYSIRRNGSNDVVVSEKFSPATIVSIPYGQPTEFSIIGNGGVVHVLRADDSSTDINSSRDTIVLTLRLFITRAGGKKKGKKRGLFFNK